MMRTTVLLLLWAVILTSVSARYIARDEAGVSKKLSVKVVPVHVATFPAISEERMNSEYPTDANGSTMDFISSHDKKHPGESIRSKNIRYVSRKVVSSKNAGFHTDMISNKPRATRLSKKPSVRTVSISRSNPNDHVRMKTPSQSKRAPVQKANPKVHKPTVSVNDIEKHIEHLMKSTTEERSGKKRIAKRLVGGHGINEKIGKTGHHQRKASRKNVRQGKTPNTHLQKVRAGGSQVSRVVKKKAVRSHRPREGPSHTARKRKPLNSGGRKLENMSSKVGKPSTRSKEYAHKPKAVRSPSGHVVTAKKSKTKDRHSPSTYWHGNDLLPTVRHYRPPRKLKPLSPRYYFTTIRFAANDEATLSINGVRILSVVHWAPHGRIHRRLRDGDVIGVEATNVRGFGGVVVDVAQKGRHFVTGRDWKLFRAAPAINTDRWDVPGFNACKWRAAQRLGLTRQYARSFPFQHGARYVWAEKAHRRGTIRVRFVVGGDRCPNAPLPPRRAPKYRRRPRHPWRGRGRGRKSSGSSRGKGGSGKKPSKVPPGGRRCACKMTQQKKMGGECFKFVGPLRAKEGGMTWRRLCTRRRCYPKYECVNRKQATGQCVMKVARTRVVRIGKASFHGVMFCRTERIKPAKPYFVPYQ